MINSVLCYLEESAKRFPAKTAFFDEDSEITFLELKRRALDLANGLMHTYGKRKSPVLVYLPKSVESIVAFMGILYSGNFYTPTDVRFPAEKILSIIDALSPEVIIVDSDTKKKMEGFGISPNILLYNIEEVKPCNQYEDSSRLLAQILDVDPVYTFFTSGSTGTPKGVTITNHNVIDYIDWAVSALPINESTVMGSQSPFYFDISTQDIYAALKTGATLGIIPVRYFAFPVQVLNYINERGINFLYWVPSAFVNVATYRLLEKVTLPKVTAIMFGGEVMPVKHLNYWKKYLPNLSFIANVYGPTEATVNCTYYIVDREFQDTEVLPLGKACENTGLLLLDDEDHLISPSQVNRLGELCVYGSSLSVGYWNDPEKTAEKYMRNPLNNNYYERMYRTGDLVFYNERGELVFSGRKDFQIKHMGYRIELGEIETAAMGLPGIRSACAGYDEDKKQIILFYIAERPETESELLKAMSDIIPKYMLPAKTIRTDIFPLNDNGKIDRQKLMIDYRQGKNQ